MSTDKILIEELKQEIITLKHQLQAAEQSKDEFLRTFGHETRTPLNQILLYSELLQDQREGLLNEKQLKSLRGLDKAADRMLDIINDIIEFSYLELNQVQPKLSDFFVTDVCSYCLRIINQQARKKQQSVSLKTVVARIQADKNGLKQILIRLLDNAVKFTPQNGSLGLEVESDSSMIKFTIWDTGIGISQSDRARLFESFYQLDNRISRSYEGLGLGLSLVWHWVRLHHGKIFVKSEVGKGSRFIVSLPLCQT